MGSRGGNTSARCVPTRRNRALAGKGSWKRRVAALASPSDGSVNAQAEQSLTSRRAWQQSDHPILRLARHLRCPVTDQRPDSCALAGNLTFIHDRKPRVCRSAHHRAVDYCSSRGRCRGATPALGVWPSLGVGVRIGGDLADDGPPLYYVLPNPDGRPCRFR